MSIDGRPTGRLAGTVVLLVTGAARGIGERTARLAAARGARPAPGRGFGASTPEAPR